MAAKQILLFNPSNGETYRVEMTDEETKRAESDVEYAVGLLRNGIVDESIQTVTESVTDPIADDDFEVEDGKSHVWEYRAIVALIDSMENHIGDPIRKKDLYKNIAKDLLTLNHKVNAIMCANKWKSLLRSYKFAKENKDKTGRGPTRFQFFEEMDAVLGDNPRNSCKNTLDSSRPIDGEEEEENSMPQSPEERKVIGHVAEDDHEVEDGKSHVWEYHATIALIDSMETHIEDLSHPMRKKNVFKNIAVDLLNLNHKVSAIMCANKWKSLMRSYRIAKENKNKTGRGPTRFQFFEQMDVFLDDMPRYSCKNTEDLNNSIDIKDVDFLPQSPEVFLETQLSDAHLEHKRKRKRDNDNEKLCKLLEEQEMNKERRHQEKLEIMKKKIEIMKKKMELEERKTALLENFLNK